MKNLCYIKYIADIKLKYSQLRVKFLIALNIVSVDSSQTRPV